MRGREMQLYAASEAGDELLHVAPFVRCQIVQYEVQRFVGRQLRQKPIQKLQQFFAAVSLETTAIDAPTVHGETTEQCQCAVAGVVKLPPPRSARASGSLCRPVLQSLHAASLIEAVHQAIRWRLRIQANDVLQALGKQRIVAVLPAAIAMQAQVGHPQPLAQGLRRQLVGHTLLDHGMAQGAQAFVRDGIAVIGRMAAGQGHDFMALLRGKKTGAVPVWVRPVARPSHARQSGSASARW